MSKILYITNIKLIQYWPIFIIVFSLSQYLSLTVVVHYYYYYFVSEADYTLDDSYWNLQESPVGEWYLRYNLFKKKFFYGIFWTSFRCFNKLRIFITTIIIIAIKKPYTRTNKKKNTNKNLNYISGLYFFGFFFFIVPTTTRLFPHQLVANNLWIQITPTRTPVAINSFRVCIYTNKHNTHLSILYLRTIYVLKTY